MSLSSHSAWFKYSTEPNQYLKLHTQIRFIEYGKELDYLKQRVDKQATYGVVFKNQ
jgi:hypothetical protein